MEESIRLLTTEEAASILKIETRTLNEYCRKKKIPYIKIGRVYRFKLSTLLNWIDKQERLSR